MRELGCQAFSISTLEYHIILCKFNRVNLLYQIWGLFEQINIFALLSLKSLSFLMLLINMCMFGGIRRAVPGSASVFLS